MNACDCNVGDLLDKTRQLIEQTTDMDAEKTTDVLKLQKRVNKLGKIVDTLKKVQDAHLKRQSEYEHLMLDLVKRREINVHHTKRKVRTHPWLTGHERTKELQKIERERKQKKAKTRN